MAPAMRHCWALSLTSMPCCVRHAQVLHEFHLGGADDDMHVDVDMARVSQRDPAFRPNPSLGLSGPSPGVPGASNSSGGAVGPAGGAAAAEPGFLGRCATRGTSPGGSQSPSHGRVVAMDVAVDCSVESPATDASEGAVGWAGHLAQYPGSCPQGAALVARVG
jgi:hypothetical protein